MWHLHSIPHPVAVDGFYTAFTRKIPQNFIFRGETHDFYELLLLLKGSVGITAGSDSLVLEAPAAILHPPMEFHSLRSVDAEEAEVMVFSFSASAMPAFKKRRFSLSDKDLQRAEAVLMHLHHAMEFDELQVVGQHKGKEREAQEALLEFEILLLSLNEHDATGMRDGSAGAKNYRRALAIIEENLSIPLDTATLSRLAHMSPSLLKKTFSRYAGVGVMEYLRNRKVNAAIPRLRAGESVKEIAASLGFTDAGYFSTVFRRVTGHSPSHYRKN